MNQANSDAPSVRAKNGKTTNNANVAKGHVAAIFKNKEAADAAVAKLIEAEFTDNEVKFTPSEMSDKGDYVVIVYASEKANIALEILVNAGGDTQTNQPEQIAEQAQAAPTVPDGVPDRVPNGENRL